MAVEYCTSSFLKRLQRKLSLFANTPRRLTYEKNKVFLRGREEDIASMWCLDQEISDLTRSFNNVGRVPDEVVNKIDRHIKALGTVFKRVIAYKTEKEIPVKDLEYLNPFQSQWGSQIEQRVAWIRLGV